MDGRHGLGAGSGGDWDSRLAQLRDYQHQHGDAHAGNRAGDDTELGRWAAAQRSVFAEGQLSEDRHVAVLLMGCMLFCVTGGVCTCNLGVGRNEQHSGAHAGDLCMIRWMTVQCSCRVGALRNLGFEFDGEAAEWERWYNELSRFQVNCRMLPAFDADRALAIVHPKNLHGSLR